MRRKIQVHKSKSFCFLNTFLHVYSFPFNFGLKCPFFVFCSGFTTTIISSTSTLPARIDYNCTTIPYKHYYNPSTTVFSKLRPSHFTLQSPLLRQSTHSTPTPPIVENIISDHYCHRRTLRRSDSYSPGILKTSWITSVF